MSIHDRNKRHLEPWRKAQYDFDDGALRGIADTLFEMAAVIHLAHPFETLKGPMALLDEALFPLLRAMPDLERRDTIVMAGRSPLEVDWVGCCGYFTGTFEAPFLDIPPTGHQAALRFHEFYRFENSRVVEFQGLWDIPELMMQADAWPMAPSLGREWNVPAPATQDGLNHGPHDEEKSQHSWQLVSNMLAGLGNFSTGGVEAMQLEKFWHPNFSWYGPAGIGTARGISGFRNWHQIPFLNAMPDRVGTLGEGNLFGDGEYVGFTAWPGMNMTLDGDGFLGIPPVNRKITMRSLDFWRCENGLIRENWVLVDLLHVYRQIGVDVLARMREFNKARR